DAYESKFPCKTEELEFTESAEQYSRYYRDVPHLDVPCFDDDLDSELKISDKDILKSFEKLFSKKVFYGPIPDPYLVRTQQEDINQIFDSSGSIQTYFHNYPTIPQQVDFFEHMKAIESGIPNKPSNYGGRKIVTLSGPTKVYDQKRYSDSDSDRNSDDTDLDEDDNEDLEFSEEESDEDTNVKPKKEPISEDMFIDDSESFSFDLQNLGDTLPEQLMKVSIQVHEEVYGIEKVHDEKLYLKNWYGNSSFFFVNCSTNLENPEQKNSEKEDNAEEFNRTEKEQIEMDMKEDFAYFGYALYEDDFNEFPILDNDEDDSLEQLEQATEEISLHYHLRRLLRERSYECITNYFLKLSKPTSAD
ncbi:predicted protein, partial [Naegleria gruberi]